MTIIGYARVSTDGQSLRSQTEALHGAGCARIFAEKISGAYSDRPQLAKAIAALAEGDTLVVCKLDIRPHSFHRSERAFMASYMLCSTSLTHTTPQFQGGHTTCCVSMLVSCECWLAQPHPDHPSRPDR